MQHDYGLDWIDQDRLYDVTKKTFKSAISRASAHSAKKTPPDPFTLMAQAAISHSTFENALSFEAQRQINKAISNSVGLWHQHVLGLAKNWTDTGASGGGLDLRMEESTRHEKWGKRLFAEVKNRYNTIKASTEKDLWDQLKSTAVVNDAIAYVFQIVPENTERYDQPWKVSGRNERDDVRCCDGVTAYEIVFGRKDALHELYDAFPKILADVLESDQLKDANRWEDLFYGSMPD